MQHAMRVGAAQLRAFSFVLPALALIGLFLIYPIASVVLISFQQYNLLGAGLFIGLRNYQFIFADPRFYSAVANTLYFVALGVPIQMVVGLCLALLVNRALLGRRWLRTSFFVPLALSFAAAGIVFRWLFSTAPLPGFVPMLFAGLGIVFPAWLSTDGAWAMPMVVLMNTWKVAGYTMIIYLAGLQTINGELFEAASIDGAGNGWQQFRFISWPLLVPTTALLVITHTIGSFRAFEPMFVMTGGGPAGATTTLVYYLFTKFPNLMGQASAASTILLVGVLLITALQFSVSRRAEAYF